MVRAIDAKLFQSIIAIHGLDGHLRQSFTADNGMFWLEHALPARIRDSRVMTYGWDADTQNRTHLTEQTIFDNGQQLISDIANFREIDNVNLHRLL